MQKVIILSLILAIISGIAFSQVPQLINYQGVLIDSGTNQPVPDDTYSIAFSIYDVASGGTAVWTETQSVTTQDGLYSVLLGSITTLKPVIFSGTEKYIGIKVGSDPEMTPRKRIVSVAYAYVAESVSGIANTFPTDGNVGIGTKTPGEKLQVAGTIHSSTGGFKFPDASVQTTAATGGGNTLDQAYDQGGAGAGRTIVADAGAFEVGGIDGVLFTGTIDNGTIPTEGAGARMVWYPNKAAFRAGHVGNTQWNDVNIGDNSIAMGTDTKASGRYSTALGLSTIASGQCSMAMGYDTKATTFATTAMGYQTAASAFESTAMGYLTKASGEISTAMGYQTEAGGTGSTAMGMWTKASGTGSTAMGSYVSTSGEGALIIGDYSTTTTLSKAAENRFYARFANGYYFYTDANASMGANLLGGANSWSSFSDSTKKENFKAVDGESILKRISGFRLGTWNYKGQDAQKYRHYGPMAQDFYAAFGYDGIGTIGNDTTLASADFDGINFIAIQALEKRTREQQAKISEHKQTTIEVNRLQSENARLKTEILQLRKEFASLSERLKQVQTQTAMLLNANREPKAANIINRIEGE
jgi:hypothetical protein